MNEENKRPASKKEKSITAILLLVNTLLFFMVYRVLLFYAERTDRTFASFMVMISYLALLLGFTLAYLIYNRFLYRRGLTADQLPDTWSEAEKEAFLKDEADRRRRSRWMMLIIFPLVFTFLIDAFDLFIVDMLWRR